MIVVGMVRYYYRAWNILSQRTFNKFKSIKNYVSLMASSIHHFHFSTKFSFSALNIIFSMAAAGWVSWNTRDGDDAPVS